jgi:UDP-GlcNAc:undecaprenyl-phosphate GlcNAc-1-phosphate transferase
MNYIAYFLLPFALSLLFTPIIRIIALKNNLISYPRADRWHKKPTAILGGLAIYFSAVISIFLLNIQNKNIWGLFLGGTILFVVGLVDDKFHLAPYTKLFMQILAGCVAIFSGIVLGLPVHNFLAIPLTLLWIVGVTNSFNLLDNIDGLAAGIAAISALMLFFSSLIFSSSPLVIYGLILSGAVLGFLPYNFNPAKIFMGDSGSMFLGYSLAVISISGTTRHISNLFITLLVPVLILSVPIFDTIFVMILRTIQGRKIFEGGKDHTSHQLVTLGLSQRKTVLLLYFVSIVFGSIAFFYSQFNAYVISIITILAIIILLFFGLFLSEANSSKVMAKKVKNHNNAENKTILNTMFLHKRRIVEVLVDLALICIAYYSAYFLRFGKISLPSNMYLISESLAWIIFIKMSVFFTFGLYRGVWRYVSISDLITIFKVVSLASVGSILFLTFVFRFREYSRAVFFLDWILLLFLVSGARISFRVLGEFFSRAREKGNNVLIFGAGDTGEMVMREIKRNKSLNYNPIGFIDDDPFKIGNKIQGIPILGSREKIRDLALREDVKEILIAIQPIQITDFSEIVEICRDCGISYRMIRGILDREDKLDIGKN